MRSLSGPRNANRGCPVAQKNLTCARCRNPITQNDFTLGLVTPRGIVCQACAAAMTPEQRAAALRGEPGAIHAGLGPGFAAQAAAGDAPKGPPWKMIAIAGGAVAVLAVAGVFLLGGSGKPVTKAKAKAKKEVAKKAEKPSPDVVRAQRLFAQLDIEVKRAQKPPRELVGELEDFTTEFAGKADDLVERAEGLLETVQEPYSKEAEKAYAKAVATAKRIATEDDPKMALMYLHDFEKKYAASTWFRDSGKALLEAEAKSLASVRDDKMRALLALARRSAAAGRFGHALEVLEEEVTKEFPEELEKEARAVVQKARDGEAAAVDDAGHKRRRAEAWKAFLEGFFEAARTSLAEAERFIHRERDGVLFLEADAERLKRLWAIVDPAKPVEKEVRRCVLNTRGSLRFTVGNEEIAGHLMRSDEKSIVLKRNYGGEVTVPWSALSAHELLEFAKVLRSRSPFTDSQLALYYLLKSQPKTAKRYLETSKRYSVTQAREDLGKALAFFGDAVPEEVGFVEETEAVAAKKKEEARVAAARARPILPRSSIPGERGAPGQWGPGLIAQSYDSASFRSPLDVRIDPAIDYYYGDAGLNPELEEKFGARWSGWILIPRDGTYAFRIEGPEDCLLVLGGRTVAEQTRKTTENLELTAGLYPIRFQMFNREGTCRARLWWRVPGSKMAVVPAHRFFHAVPKGRDEGATARLVSGIKAEYYAGTSFERRILTEVRADPSFDLGELPPVGECPADGFSVRMTGFLHVPERERVTLVTGADDGYKISIAEKPWIDCWDRARPRKMTKYLEPGFHPILVEYRHEKGKARLEILASVPPDHAKRPAAFRLGTLWCERERPVAPLQREGRVPGLTGTYVSPLGTVRLRDPSPNFSWGRAAPARGVPPTGFKVTWTGTLLIPDDGTYWFRVIASGPVEVIVGGHSVLATTEGGRAQAQIDLQGESKSFELKYANRGFVNDVEVLWSGPKFGFRRLGGEFLCSAGDVKLASLDKSKDIVLRRMPKIEDDDPALAQARKDAKEREKVALVNGGFEKIRKETRLPMGWAYFPGGDAVRGYARTDRSTPHDGDAAVVVRTQTDGARPGIRAVLMLPPGTYELRYWACTEFDKTAQVYSHVAGRDLTVRTVGEEYKEFVEKVVLMQRVAPADVRLGTASTGVRVYFDDVSLKPLGPPPELRKKKEDDW